MKNLNLKIIDIKKKKSKIFFSCLFIFLLICSLLYSVKAEDELKELDVKIKERRQSIEELKKQQKIYEKNIKIKQQEIISLKNQVDLLDNHLTKTKIEIEMVETEIESNNLEQENLKLQIEEKEKKIGEQKEKIAEIIRLIYREDQRSYLEILLLNDSLADFFNQIKYSESLQEALQDTLDKLQLIREALLVQKKDLEVKKENLEKLKERSTRKRAQLEYQAEAKKVLLTQTEGAEKKFQSLLIELRREQEEINAEIVVLEQRLRIKLTEREKGKEFEKGIVLNWPVPKSVVTAYFHDPDYPFRYIFEHPGIDIRAKQGTPVKAAASGYVARAKDAGMGYSYILIIHDGGISTVYGHLSKIFVSEDTYVTRGQVIGLSGGLPGTRGAGRLTTGAHLHFEVRMNGIPVNPLGYLP